MLRGAEFRSGVRHNTRRVWQRIRRFLSSFGLSLASVEENSGVFRVAGVTAKSVSQLVGNLLRTSFPRDLGTWWERYYTPRP